MTRLPDMYRLIALVVVSAAVYTYGLARVPGFLTLDEAHFSVHAHALAETGRNLNGQRLPLLISLEDPEGEQYELPWGQTYYLPFGIYLIAGALQVLPLDEAAVRLPSALLGGLVNVGLLFAVALVLFRDRTVAVCSAAILMLSPAHLIISRQAVDSVCQLPFTLGFLWCLGRYVQAPHPRLALAAGAILGLGIYAYVTSVVFMPFFLVVFWVAAWRAGTLDRPAVIWSIGGFAAAIVPMAAWLAWHPAALASISEQYNRADPGAATLTQAVTGGGLAEAAREFVRIYWSYFDPSFLFVQGGNARNISTGEVGVFLMPVAMLAPWGFRYLRKQPTILLLLVIGLLAAPIPAALKGTPYQIQRASGLLIFVSLFAGVGLAALLSSRRPWGRIAAAAITVAMIWQFTGFYRDYFTNYRIRSGHAYDPTAFRGAADLILSEDARAPIDEVYIPAGFYDASAKWRFYTVKHERPDLWRQTKYFASAVSELQPASNAAVAVVPLAGEHDDIPGWTTVGVVRNLMGAPTAAVLRRAVP